MTVLPSPTEVPDASSAPHDYRIHLKIASTCREDAWDMCLVALRYGGVEVSDCCFVFVNEEHWLIALESLRSQFGAKFFQAAGWKDTPLTMGTYHVGES